MKKFSYLLFMFLLSTLMLCGCGGSPNRKSGNQEGGGGKKTGILDYNAPALPKFEPVDSIRDFSNTEPVITENTKRIILPEFSTDYQFHDGMLGIRNRQTNKWGFIDTEGNLVIDFVWHAESPRFNHGVAVVGKSNSEGVVQRINTWYIIDKQGDIVKEFPKEVSYVSQFTDGYAYVMENINSTFYYINTEGEQIFNTYRARYNSGGMTGTHFRLRPLSEGLIALYHLSIQKWGFVDKQGNEVIPAIFSDVCDFSEGLAAVKFPATETNASKWGFIDREGNVVINPIFTNPVSSFSGGYAVATQSNKRQVYIDKTGRAVSPEYKQAYPFKNGKALVHFKGEMSMIDRDLNLIMDKLLLSEMIHLVPSTQDTIRHSYYYNSLDSPRITYHGEDNYFTLHHHNTGTLSSNNLFAPDGSRHTLLSCSSHFSNKSTEYNIWNFYGNLAHATYYSSGRGIGPLNGIIDFNKGLEYVILFDKSQF